MTEDFQRLDRVLSALAQALDTPGADPDGSAEPLWRKMDVLYESMGADALRAMLRRQGVGSGAVDDALAVLERRRTAMS